MTIRFSTRAPNSDYLGFEASPEAIIAAAKKAEEVGFDAIFVNDHIVVGDDARSAPWTNVYDPFVAMSFIAAHTTRIGVGVSVLIMPYRNPITTAKALATLERMSGGRVIAGIGVGWNEAEFAALGVPFHERGARTNEYLRLWQACWTPGKVSFAGRFVTFADMHVSPKPVRPPPIWIGGASEAALRRAARFAAVWQPTPMPITQLIEARVALREACVAISRPLVPTRMSFRVEFSTITGNAPPPGKERPAGCGTPAQVAEDLRRYRTEAGLDSFQINFHGNRDLGQLLKSMECFMAEVAPVVSSTG
jgi:probable F420-dependent oxidoreductase